MNEKNILKKHDRVLVAWIGDTDLKKCKFWNDPNLQLNRGSKSLPDRSELGPIINSLVNSDEYAFDRVVLLDSMRSQAVAQKKNLSKTIEYASWASFCISQFKKQDLDIELKSCPLKDPTDFARIYEHAEKIIDHLINSGAIITINFTPGTAHMAAVWIAIAKKFTPNLRLIQTSPESGTKTMNVPFRLIGDIDFGKVSDCPDKVLANSRSENDPSPFSDIIYSCDAMDRLISFSKKIARLLSNNTRDNNNGLSVHIYGPTGSGKEGIANGIHKASGRAGEFVAVNCAAIPKELFESEMFGFVKGAFTGANFDKIGKFEQADGGTLFLDEIGDIPLEQQTKLLRAIQERKITRTGSTEEKSIDVNIITATHRNLGAMVEEKTFREDLFYRLTTVCLEIPSLKARGQDDIRMLLEFYLERFNDNFGASKTLSKEALDIFLHHDWPGNVRELQNTITRAAIFSDEHNEISGPMARDSILFRQSSSINAAPLEEKTSNIFMPVAPDSNGYVNLQSVLDEVESAYLDYALAKTEYNKSKAAALLGFGNYQTLSNRRKKIEERKK